MAKKNTHPPNTAGTNSNLEPQTGGINPSAPTSGTEGWGTNSDECNIIASGSPSESTPNTRAAGDIRHTSYPRNEIHENPATSGLRSFRCADAGYKDCGWSVTASGDEEIFKSVIDHRRSAHSSDSSDEDLQLVRGAIRRQAA